MIEKTRTDLAGMTCSASFSEDERHRYLLTWRWSDAPLLVAWMLNPSTATHEHLDPTIKGLKNRAENWGMGGVRVINLFAYRATDPANMKKVPDPIGPENDVVTVGVLTDVKRNGDLVVAGWGAHGVHLRRNETALRLADQCEAPLHYLALTQEGHPGHPLYLKQSIRPVRWACNNA